MLSKDVHCKFGPMFMTPNFSSNRLRFSCSAMRNRLVCAGDDITLARSFALGELGGTYIKSMVNSSGEWFISARFI